MRAGAVLGSAAAEPDHAALGDLVVQHATLWVKTSPAGEG
jgi:hypothetical protein